MELYLIPAVMPSCSQMQRQLYFRENNTDTYKILFYEFYLCVAVLKLENAILVKNSLPSAFLLESALLCITIN